MATRKSSFDFNGYHKKFLVPLLKKAPFVLRITEWKDYPVPVLVIKERRNGQDENIRRNDGSERPVRLRLHDIGYLAGDAQRRCLPILRRIVEKVRDPRDIPLELERYLTVQGLRLRINLPLDEEAGAKLGLIFRLQARIRELDRVELLARRIARFSAEEAGYWLSRTLHYGPDAGRWALSGLRIMMAGQPRDPGVERMLERLRTGF